MAVKGKRFSTYIPKYHRLSWRWIQHNG